MARAKVKKQSTLIDMTAMSDVTVLLLTFFMLTSSFVKEEPILVSTPSSISEIKIPETNIVQILIEPTGKVFMSMDRQDNMLTTLESMGKEYNITFTPSELNSFRLATTFGVPMNLMKSYLQLPADKQKLELAGQGIPTDSLNNQFRSWMEHARAANPDLRIAIKADKTTPYSTIKNVMNTLQDLRENRYNLITSLKTVAD